MRDLRGLIKNDNFDQGGWCLDEKRNLIHNLVKTTLVGIRFFTTIWFI
jgi:hypothetical protein